MSLWPLMSFLHCFWYPRDRGLYFLRKPETVQWLGSVWALPSPSSHWEHPLVQRSLPNNLISSTSGSSSSPWKPKVPESHAMHGLKLFLNDILTLSPMQSNPGWAGQCSGPPLYLPCAQWTSPISRDTTADLLNFYRFLLRLLSGLCITMSNRV